MLSSHVGADVCRTNDPATGGMRQLAGDAGGLEVWALKKLGATGTAAWPAG
eukprot:gene18375-20225_t